jgi:flagellar basal-body rod modification protein FlgD
MALSPITSSTAQSAFGLDFQSLLSIILTQLTYQDPLKPVDNFEFVSQLGQFAQLQQSQTLNDQITSLLSAQAANQATSLLGKTVDVSSGIAPASGIVQAVSFSGATPQVTIRTSDGSIITGISMGSITQVR